MAAQSNEGQLTKMTLMIVLTFMISWAPHTMTTLDMMIVDPTYELEMLQIMCVTLAYSATLQHPLLYAFMRRNFRKALALYWTNDILYSIFSIFTIIKHLYFRVNFIFIYGCA